MKIYYDTIQNQWFQTDIEEPVTFGGEGKYIVYRENGGNLEEPYFKVRMKRGRLGPLVGILAARKQNGGIAGNITLFMEIQKKLISLDGISFIFTPEGVGGDGISGYVFLPEKYKWIKAKFPYPDLVYNRIPFRKQERHESFIKVITRLKSKNIPFFNPGFIDKQELHSVLANHPVLTEFWPRTIEAGQKNAVFQFLEEHNSIYLKPSQSSKGRGIYRLTLEKDGKVKLEGIKSGKVFPSFTHFWNEWEEVITNVNYLAQEEIKSLRFRGKRFDFRILAHAETGGYGVTGIGIRQSQDQEITTHIPSGGRLLPYALFQSEERDQLIHKIVNAAGQALTERFGFFGEFSVDGCVSLSGRFYIFEINSKPMSFDEPDIEKQRILHLCQLFLELSSFQK